MLGVLFKMEIFCSDLLFLIRNPLSFLFLCFFCSQIFIVKLNLQTKIGLNLCIFYSSDFLDFLSKKIVFTFCAEFELLMLHNNIVKVRKLKKRNLLKICL